MNEKCFCHVEIDGEKVAVKDVTARAAANEAKTTANAAKATADGIAGTASSAVTIANAANTTANAAKTTANAAKTTADGIAGTASAAVTIANEAKTIANEAKTLASNARPYSYTVMGYDNTNFLQINHTTYDSPEHWSPREMRITVKDRDNCMQKIVVPGPYYYGSRLSDHNTYEYSHHMYVCDGALYNLRVFVRSETHSDPPDDYNGNRWSYYDITDVTVKKYRITSVTNGIIEYSEYDDMLGIVAIEVDY